MARMKKEDDTKSIVLNQSSSAEQLDLILLRKLDVPTLELIASHRGASENAFAALSKSNYYSVRAKVAKNQSCPVEIRTALTEDVNYQVRKAAKESLRVTDALGAVKPDRY